MPRRKGNKKNGKKAVDRSSGWTGNNLLAPTVVPVPRAIGVPPVRRLKHRYCEMGSLTSTTGSLVSYVFKANSLNDPNQTGGGHQPYGFDQTAALYQRWQVLSSRIYFEAVTAVGAMLCGVITSSESSVVSTLTAANLLTEPGRGQAGMSTPSAPARAFEARWDLNALYPDHDPGDFEGTANADCTRIDYYTIYAQDPALATSSVLYYTVVLEYDCLWKDPATIVSS